VIEINLTNTYCKVIGDLKQLNKLRNELRFRHPNAWFLRAHMPRGWDGYVYDISESGTIKVGLIPKLINKCNELKIKYRIIDRRDLPKFIGIPKKLANFKLRPYQLRATNSLVSNSIDETAFPIGVINAATNAGKCIGKNVLVSTEGGLLRLPEIKNPIGLKVLNEYGLEEIRGLEYCGKIPMLKITMESGIEIEAGYDNHRFKVLSDKGWKWVYIKNLSIGDTIPIKYGANLFGESELTPEIGYLLGCIHGDGHINELKSGFSITSEPKNISLLRTLQSILISDLGMDKVEGKVKLKSDGNFRLSKSGNQLKNLFKKTPELCCNAHHKRVPNIILQSSKAVQKQYIRGYFDTDGSSSKNRNYKVSITSVSKRGLLDLQQMLLNMGIITRIKPRVTGYYSVAKGERVRGITFRLTISSYEGYKFLTQIGFGLPSKQGNFQNYKGDYFKENINVLPAYCYPFLSDLFKQLNYRNRDSRYPIGRWLRRGTNIKVHLIEEIIGKHIELNHLPSYQFLKECVNGLFFDRVAKIEKIFDDAWDIEVNNTHSYISNGFISHNTLIISAIHSSYKNVKTLVLLNSTDLFNQALKEFPQMLPNTKLGFIQGSKYTEWGDFTVAMVQTLSRNLSKYKSKLTEFDICITDECDLADNKTYKSVLNKVYNAPIRVGLSGTVYLSTLKKDQLKNNNIRSFFGEEIFKISKTELVKKGYSTNLVIKIVPGGKGEGSPGNYPKEYDDIIVNNIYRERAIIDRVRFNLDRGRLPLLIVCQYHHHVDRLYGAINVEFGKDYNVRFVHHKILDRKEIFADFKVGKIDILISSMIVKRGQNLPLIRTIINAAGGDSHANISQIMGRGERIHQSKTKVFIEDFFDDGKFLSRHSKHRINYYRKEGFKVIKLF
jgi:intein/homing endonuclease